MDPSTLLEHREFVKAVARALLGNEADVEDAVQETYFAALQAEPPRTGRVRPWLGGIARNVAKRLYRTRARRLRREQAAARPDRAAEESTEKLRWQQRVVEEVLALDPKYRDVLLLRYYEELPPREIAAQLELPVNTVRTRTRRALEKLRHRFDERYGRAAWSAALAGFFATEAAAGSGKLVAAALVALVAGTAWLGHVALREEGATSPRRTEARGDDAGAVSAAGLESAASRASGDEEARPVPTHFHGRCFDWGAKDHPPLAGATVFLSSSRFAWDPVASATTDAEGRFSFRWDPRWSVGADYQGNMSYHLYVRWERRWSDPMYARPSGLDEGMDVAVVLIPLTRFQIVRGEDRAPVAGVRTSLHPVPNRHQPELEPPIASGRTGPDGIFEAEWPSYMDTALLRVAVPGGDFLQLQLDAMQVRSFDPYDISIDAEEIATVYVRVLDREGEPSGPGTQVYVEGRWAPDADSDPADWKALGRGAQPRPLLGVTDADGRATFRFPADRARYGAYVPERMIAYDDSPDFAVLDRFERLREQIAGNGESLPTLRLGTSNGARPFFFVAGHPDGYFEVHWRGSDGETRILDVYLEARIPGHTVCRFLETGPGPLRGRGALSVVAHLDDGFAWTSMQESEFARCLGGGSAIRLDRRASARSILIHPSANGDLVLDRSDFPWVVREYLAAGFDEHLTLPDVAGTWRVRFEGKASRFDATESSILELP